MSNLGFFGDATFLRTQTNWFIQMYNNVDDSTARIIAPEVKVASMAGYYEVFDSRQGFQKLETRKNPGEKAVQVGRKPTRKSYVLEANALDLPIPRQLVEQTDRESANALFQGWATEHVATAVTSYEYKTWNTISASVDTDTDYGAGWIEATGSNPPVNPLDELEEASYDMWTEAGVFPNTMILGPTAWRALKFCTQARGTFPIYAANDEQFKTYLSGFGAGNLRNVKVATMGYSNNEGQTTRTITPIVESNAIYLAYVSPMPVLGDPSGAKTLVFGPGLTPMRTYWSEDQRDLVLALDWNVLPVVTNTYAIKRIVVG